MGGIIIHHLHHLINRNGGDLGLIGDASANHQHHPKLTDCMGKGDDECGEQGGFDIGQGDTQW